MTILGIDPGTARMGWGVINLKNPNFKETIKTNGEKITKAKLELLKKEMNALNGQRLKGNVDLLKYGCVVTNKDDAVGKRLVSLHRQLDEILQTHKPEMIAIERLFFGINAKTGIAVGQGIGVILFTIAQYEIPVVEYTGLQVKLTVAGDGKADKKMIQAKVKDIFSASNTEMTFSAKDHAWDDAADALAIAICHVLK